MKPRKPFQFSLATLMLVVTAYAVLFGDVAPWGSTTSPF